MVRFHDTLIVAYKGQVSTSGIPSEPKIWRLKTASQAAVWWLQNPGKTFEALTTAAVADQLNNP
jgi:hypothetical protein